MMDHIIRIPFETIYNFRDLGGYATADGRVTAFGRIYRCDNLADISANDRRKIIELGINTVIDLRTKYEAEQAPNAFSHRRDIEVIQISPLDSYMDLSSFSKTAAAADVCISDVYIHNVEYAKAKYREAIGVIAARMDKKIVFHCTAGKDRTGILSMLLFGICQVSEEDIIANYQVSSEYLKRKTASLLDQRFYQLTLSEPAFMEILLEHIQRNYGGILPYLDRIGVTKEEICSIRDGLCIPRKIV